ncbi:hypothetical protein CS542_07520 [Pedobacter sp. IW39]|nr:hypothetical protein CS542_07520 [Pedobacter sp. IW39]
MPCGSAIVPSARNTTSVLPCFNYGFYPRWKPILPIALPGHLLFLAQIYVGVHYPIDTIAGAALAQLSDFSVPDL